MVDTLYTGPELREAADRSDVYRSIRESLRGWRNAVGVLSDVIRKRLSERTPGYELVRATGNPPGFDSSVSAIYAGTGANRAYCLSLVFDRYTETAANSASAQEILRELEGATDDCPIVFTEGIDLPTGDTDWFEMPAWVKQRLAISEDWPAQIDTMRRETRQEIGRILRKFGYGCRLSHDTCDHADFYDRLYVPFASNRFESTALVVERQQFLRECRRGVVIQLMHEAEVVGAALLRRLGRTMGIVWSGLATGTGYEKLRGRTDALDYFSLLYGHLTGCRWLDFGPSRPDLYDGALRYKAKWGAELHAGKVAQGMIRCIYKRGDPGVTGFLRRHAFLNRTSAGFAATIWIAGYMSPEELRRKRAALATPGVSDYRTVVLSPLDPRLDSLLEESGLVELPARSTFQD